MNQTHQGAGSGPIHNKSHDTRPETAAGPGTEVLAPQEDAPCRNRTYNLVIKSHRRHLSSAVAPCGFGDGSVVLEQERADSDPCADGHFHDISHDTRRCPRCSQDLPLDAFGTRTRRGKRTPLPYCRPCMVAYHREWRATEAGAAKFAAGESASKARHPARLRARHQVRAAIARGTLERGPCYAAGDDCTGAVEAHHDDYSRPLAVVWTCRGHHRALDQARRERDAQPMERAA